MRKRTKPQSKKALTEWKAFRESEFWYGLIEAIEDKKKSLAEDGIKERGDNFFERFLRKQGRYEAFNIDFPLVIKNYIKDLEKETGQSLKKGTR